MSVNIFSIVKPVEPHSRHVSFTHLRRVVTLEHLPVDLTWRRDYDSNGLQTVFLLLPNTTVSWQTICATLNPHIDDPGLPRCFNCVVPRYAPLTAEQAEIWTERYWPCVFNPASQVIQDAPPLHQLRRIRGELETSPSQSYMDLALSAAQATEQIEIGRAIGAVVVNSKTQEIVAIAGDARWWSKDESQYEKVTHQTEGRPEYHALMRVIAMVAKRELSRRLQSGLSSKFESPADANPIAQLLTDVEKNNLGRCLDTTFKELTISSKSSSRSSSVSSRQSSTKAEGYLCSGLDLYLTHEPCVCCAMAMIHSRFRSCIFQQKMPATGGLTAEQDSLRYGLFWRRELNWRVLTFQHIPQQGRSKVTQEEEFHA